MSQITPHSCIREVLLRICTAGQGRAGFPSPMKNWERLWVSTSAKAGISDLGFLLRPPPCKVAAVEISCVCIGFRLLKHRVKVDFPTWWALPRCGKDLGYLVRLHNISVILLLTGRFALSLMQIDVTQTLFTTKVNFKIIHFY